MMNAKPEIDFWTSTLRSAKEAVHLYFEPLRGITAWLPALRPEVEGLRKRLLELELELARVRKLEVELQARQAELAPMRALVLVSRNYEATTVALGSVPDDLNQLPTDSSWNPIGLYKSSKKYREHADEIGGVSAIQMATNT